MPNESISILGHFKETKKYKLTVEEGTGSGEYEAGEKVSIRAESKKGSTFEYWEVKPTSLSVKFDDSKKSSTKIEMPSRDVTIAPYYTFTGDTVTITKQPQSQAVKLGEKYTFSIGAKNAEKYQWEMKEAGGSRWINLNQNTAKLLSRGGLMKSQDGAQFRCIVSNGGGSVTSDIAILTVNAMGIPDPDTPKAPETGTPETGTPETGEPETGTPETGEPETGTPETGEPKIPEIEEEVAPLIDTEKLRDGIKGERYSSYLYLKNAATGIKWSTIGKLPPGITLDKDTGQILGTPTKVGEYSFTIKVKNKLGEDEKSVSIKIIDKEEIEMPGGIEEGEEIEELERIEGYEPRKETMSFVDVAKTSWYYGDVKTAYESRLVDGKTSTEYKPNDSISFSEAIKLAACMHQLYHRGGINLVNGKEVWYSTYVDYADENKIIDKKAIAGKEKEIIKRKEFVDIFYNALPGSGYMGINRVNNNKIPDVKIKDDYADKIYAFYRAGILTGSDEKGTFKPESNIQRSEVAAILTRMFNEDARKNIELQ